MGIFAAKSKRGIGVVIADELLRQICAKVELSAEGEDLERSGRATKSCSARCEEEY